MCVCVCVCVRECVCVCVRVSMTMTLCFNAPRILRNQKLVQCIRTHFCNENV